MNHTLEYVVIGIYLAFLLVLGAVFSRMNRDASDYFRSGCKGTWWLVGVSIFMGGISAITFTSNAGVAYEAGLTYLVIYLGNVIAYVINAIWLAPWFRQLRAITFPEVVRMRYGPTAQQLYAYVGLIVFLLSAAIQLWALALFSSTIFGLPLLAVIVALGVVVMLYSTTGGSWAVMGTDFVQGLIMLPMTALIAIMCLVKVGGPASFVHQIAAADFAADYALVKPGALLSGGQYGGWWVVAMLVFQISTQCSLNSGQRFFAVKDGREARRAAWLAAGLMVLGTFFWIIPPMTARLLYANQVGGLPLNSPAEGAYAIVGLNLLPNGLTGMMVVAMFAATMSSMDTGINRNAAMVVRDVLPAIRRRMRMPEWADASQVRVGQLTSLVFGLLIIGCAAYFAGASGKGIFDMAFRIGSMLGGPMAVPLVLGIFIRRAPHASVFVSIAAGALPTVVDLVRTLAFGAPGFSWQFLTLAIFGCGTIGFLATLPWGGAFGSAYNGQVDEFFERMHRPVDFKNEVGEGSDLHQLRLLGGFTIAVGAFLLLLILLPNPLSARLTILGLAAFVGCVGAFMYWRSRWINPSG